MPFDPNQKKGGDINKQNQNPNQRRDDAGRGDQSQANKWDQQKDKSKNSNIDDKNQKR